MKEHKETIITAFIIFDIIEILPNHNKSPILEDIIVKILNHEKVVVPMIYNSL